MKNFPDNLEIKIPWFFINKVILKLYFELFFRRKTFVGIDKEISDIVCLLDNTNIRYVFSYYENGVVHFYKICGKFYNSKEVPYLRGF